MGDPQTWRWVVHLRCMSWHRYMYMCLPTPVLSTLMCMSFYTVMLSSMAAIATMLLTSHPALWVEHQDK